MTALRPIAGLVLTAASCYFSGALLLHVLRLGLTRLERLLLSYITGAMLISMLMFVLCAAGLAYEPLIIGVQLAVISAGVLVVSLLRSDPAERIYDLPPFWLGVLVLSVIAMFSLWYLPNALAPETSPDGSGYHLGLVSRYLRQHGFGSITTNVYANLSQGVELIFLAAFAAGGHSAASGIHLTLLFALAGLLALWGSKFEHAAAGWAAAAVIFATPIVGWVASSAYNDVAAATFAFALFYALDSWREDHERAWLPIIGMLAGFCYAVKYTLFVAVPYALIVVLLGSRRRKLPVLQATAIVAVCAAVLVLPWMVKNAVTVNNPFSPFLNKYFPNPYVHVSFEQEYIGFMRAYGDVKDVRQIPLEVTVRGGRLQGIVGPLFLLAPLALLAGVRREGRRVLLAAILFGAGYFGNIGTRFLIPSLPFITLALMMAVAYWKPLLGVAVLVHAFSSWPSFIPRYAAPDCVRLEMRPWRAALRLMSEDDFLALRLEGMDPVRLVNNKAPSTARVFAFSGLPEAYVTRDLIVGYQGALNEKVRDLLWAPLTGIGVPEHVYEYVLPSQRVRRVRLTQTGPASQDLWSINELEFVRGDYRVPSVGQLQATASAAPWDAGLALDGKLATRWRSWELIKPGMTFDVTLAEPAEFDRLRVRMTPDQWSVSMRAESELLDGQWITLSGELSRDTVRDLRGEAMREVRRLGITHLLVRNDDYKADDYHSRAEDWGITLVGESSTAKLYRIN